MTVDKQKILKGDRQQFIQLLRPFFMSANADLQDDINSAERLAIASALWTDKSLRVDWTSNTYKQFIGDVEKLFNPQSEAFKAELQFHFKILEGYVRFSHLDRKLTTELASLRDVLLAHAIADSRFWFAAHPLRRLVDLLYQQTVGWQDNYGKNGDVIATLFTETVSEISAGALQDFSYYQSLLERVEASFEQSTQRFSKLEQRLKDSETGALKAGIANYTVINFLNKATKGKQLPPGVITALQQTLAGELKLFIIQQGLASSFWLRSKKLVEMLIKLYQAPPTSDAEKAMLIQLPKELEALIKESIPNPSAFDNLINLISFDFTQMAAGKVLDCLEPVTPLEMPGQLEGIDKKVSQSLISKARKYAEGQWFLYKDDTETMRRCHLLLSLPDYDQLLFSNYVGQKVLATTYENFAYLLSSRLMQPLFQENLTDRAICLNLDKLLEEYQVKEEQRANAEREQARRLQLKQEEEDRRIAAEKAKVEAERLAEERAARQVQETLAQIADDMKKQVKLALDSLSLGSWIEWENPADNTFKRIKLAVKFNATGRFVFVDEDGVTVLEQHKDELVEQVLLKKIKLLESDQRFAERLAKIVNNIRTGET